MSSLAGADTPPASAAIDARRFLWVVALAYLAFLWLIRPFAIDERVPSAVPIVSD